ncbi:hypothetical protein CDL15_Pgr017192 [Punica granatum]|uniref:Uncharacterized protein n=1 Tax=Punica granatum TaxID=22663 RepID=A0A218VYW9_PUNGR|nr:hypothetical protein CDL15_Pgr017192 [Punica granatum]
MAASQPTTVTTASRIEIITNDQGNRMDPSYVALIDTERLEAYDAKRPMRCRRGTRKSN